MIRRVTQRGESLAGEVNRSRPVQRLGSDITSTEVRDEIRSPPRRPTLSPAAPPKAERRALRAMLATPNALRQSILLGEILGPPMALRRGDDE